MDLLLTVSRARTFSPWLPNVPQTPRSSLGQRGLGRGGWEEPPPRMGSVAVPKEGVTDGHGKEPQEATAGFSCQAKAEPCSHGVRPGLTPTSPPPQLQL